MNFFDQLFNDPMNNPLDQSHKHLCFLSEKGGVSTRWAAFHNNTNPGFFTPFNQQLDHGKFAGIKPAAIAAGLLPAIKLTSAIVSAGLSIAMFSDGVLTTIFFGNWDHASQCFFDASKQVFAAIHFSSAFVLTLIKEATALITRSIATLVAMCCVVSLSDEPLALNETTHRLIQDGEDFPEQVHVYGH